MENSNYFSKRSTANAKVQQRKNKSRSKRREMKEFKKVLGKRSPSFKASGKVSKESKEEMVLLDDNDFASMNIRLP